MNSRTTNVVIAGLGGQGVIKASDILACAAFTTGADVKKSELHGMSQRGGSVSSDVRFGEQVFSPMICEGEADFLVVLAPDQIEVNRALLAPGGRLIEPSAIDEARLPNKKNLNIALLGVLSRYLPFAPENWADALGSSLPPAALEASLAAFNMGRDEGQQQ